jgi:hypothetical protein
MGLQMLSGDRFSINPDKSQPAIPGLCYLHATDLVYWPIGGGGAVIDITGDIL